MWENHAKCEETQRYQTCLNRKNEKLFGFRTKLLYYEVFHRIFITNRTGS